MPPRKKLQVTTAPPEATILPTINPRLYLAGQALGTSMIRLTDEDVRDLALRGKRETLTLEDRRRAAAAMAIMMADDVIKYEEESR